MREYTPHNDTLLHLLESSKKQLDENEAKHPSENGDGLKTTLRTVIRSVIGCAIPGASGSKKCDFEENVTLRLARTMFIAVLWMFLQDMWIILKHFGSDLSAQKGRRGESNVPTSEVETQRSATLSECLEC